MRYLLAGAVIALTLAGCAAQPPGGFTDAELEGYITKMQNSAWFYSARSTETRPQVQSTLVATDDMERVAGSCLIDSERSDAECDMTYLSVPEDIGYFSASELSYVYDYYASELVPCLATVGLNVGYAPTRAEYAQAGWMSWDPYSELGAELPPSRAEAILAKCPQYPPMPFSTWDDQ